MSYISRLAADQLIEIFSYLPLQQLYQVRTVCQKWFLLHSHEKLWYPILQELKPLIDRIDQHEEEIPSPSKELVLNYLKSHAKMTSAVMELVVSEEKLSLILNKPFFSLEEFKNMTHLSRSIQICKRLTIDSTGLLKSLVDQVQVVALNQFCSSNRFFVYPKEGTGTNIMHEPYAVMLLDFISKPISPYNGGEMVGYLHSAALIPIPIFNELIYKACAKIYDSCYKFPRLLVEPGFKWSSDGDEESLKAGRTRFISILP